MQCPECNYILNDFDTECPRCAKMPKAAPPVTAAAAVAAVQPPAAPINADSLTRTARG